jgi:putative hemolysin
MDITLLAFLILLNGLFAMSEMALTASRKARLQVMVDNEEPGARAALELHDNPTRFLSSVQIGITSIGILNGIVGDAAFAEPLAHWLSARGGLEPRGAAFLATALVVVVVTVLTIVFGELVPKRIGQLFPEAVARHVARPMRALARATRPLVMLLAVSTRAVLRLFGIRDEAARAVTEEEIAASLEEGVDAGIIEAQEHRMLRNVFRLDERQIGSMMIPRSDVAWIDADATAAEIVALMKEHPHRRYPVCRGGLDEVQGVIDVASLLGLLDSGRPVVLGEHLRTPVYLPETLSGMELLHHFRRGDPGMVLVVDEYGAVQGVVTEHDLLEAITGELSAADAEEAWAVQRDDGSWLMDGLIPVTELKDRLLLRELPEEGRGRYNTLAGMVILLLGRLPRTGDLVHWEHWRFEVVDLDGKRIDKVLVSANPETNEAGR